MVKQEAIVTAAEGEVKYSENEGLDCDLPTLQSSKSKNVSNYINSSPTYVSSYVPPSDLILENASQINAEQFTPTNTQFNIATNIYQSTVITQFLTP